MNALRGSKTDRGCRTAKRSAPVTACTLAAFLAAGCATGSDTLRETPPARPAGADAPAPAAGSSEPAARLDGRVQGRIVSVNPGLRFVVMDFPIRRLPAIDQRLAVYRHDTKVGEVKATGPIRETTVAGDLMWGDADLDDEVREE